MQAVIEVLEYILLGFVEGIASILPISSNGHILFLKEILNIEADSSVLLLLVLNLGSMIGVIFYFKKEMKSFANSIFCYFFKKKCDRVVIEDLHSVRNVLIGIFPILIVGSVMTFFIEDIFAQNIMVIIGVGSLMTATVLYAVRNLTNSGVKKVISAEDSWFVGFMQVFALFPGFSRLAVTTAAGVKRKLSMDTTLKFVFLMYIPVSLATFFGTLLSYQFDFNYILADFDPSNTLSYFNFFLGFAASAISTVFALKLIFVIFRKGDMAIFYIYNLIFGLTAIFIGIS
ncbi:MAG: undecaprenyl-diphosphate phosphatase [Candidatus Izemoplasmatales bacterium]|nr:undecaprenyl-diphosphate phosphatase [Candidatus Izemoplasmatales bacterium]